jgi:hypothetical protein
MNPILTEVQIREKLVKIKALFDGAGSPGERQAAQAAMDRLQQRMEGFPTPPTDPPLEYRFSFHNQWSARLFLALCRSKGFRPYRHPRMRRTSLCLQISKRAVDHDLWPEYVEMNKVLTDYMNQLADHIIAECINSDSSDVAVVQGIAGPGAEVNG